MAELLGITNKCFFKLIDLPDDVFVKYLQDLGLLHSKRTCPSCVPSPTRLMMYVQRVGEV